VLLRRVDAGHFDSVNFSQDTAPDDRILIEPSAPRLGEQSAGHDSHNREHAPSVDGVSAHKACEIRLAPWLDDDVARDLADEPKDPSVSDSDGTQHNAEESELIDDVDIAFDCAKLSPHGGASLCLILDEGVAATEPRAWVPTADGSRR
jgi:hypothetical protein